MSLAVTTRASAALKQVLDSTQHDPKEILRLVQDPEGNLGLALDTQKEGDQVVEFSGDKTLVIDQEISDRLEGVTLDIQESPQGETFTLSS